MSACFFSSQFWNVFFSSSPFECDLICGYSLVQILCSLNFMRFELHRFKFNKCEWDCVDGGWKYSTYNFLLELNATNQPYIQQTNKQTNICRMVCEWKCLCHLTRFHFSDKWNHLISDFNFRNEILWLLLPCHFE